MEISFLFPAALYGLLILPVIALLQLLLPRAVEITVGSLVFWRRAAADASVARARSLGRLPLASLLLLLILGAIILALSGPGIVRSGERGVAAVIAIDASPSLLMTDGGSASRLKTLRESVERFLSDLPDGTPVAVVTIPSPLGGRTIEGAVGEIRGRVVSAIDAGDRPLTPRTLRNRLLLLHNQTTAPIVLFTDISPYDEQSPQPPFVHLVCTGGRATNLALTRAKVTYRPDGPFAMVSWRASAGLDAKGAITLSGPGIAPLQVAMQFKEGQDAWTFPVPQALPEKIVMALDLADDFAADNRMPLVRTEARRRRIGYVGRSDPSLVAVMQAAEAEVYEIDLPARAIAASAGEGPSAGLWPEGLDLTVFVDRLPPGDFQGPAVLVNPPSSSGPLQRGAASSGPVREWTIPDPGHPLVAHLSMRGPRIAERPQFKLAAGATAVITTGQGDPLVVTYRDGGSTRVAVLFDISAANTDWPRQVSFVLFWSNCLAFLSAGHPATVRYEPATVIQAGVGDVEGRQSAGPAIDQSAEALAALATHRSAVRPSEFALWPAFAILALLLLVVRTRVIR
ncbi:MAG: hypothetical protein GWP05_07920 [Anaerolineaceae bacterium]|nr:hypothetical protein [Anaerolineaceae bacterium]